MHAFTFKILNDVQNHADNKDYARDIDNLAKVYLKNLQNHDRSAMPTNYSASYMDAIYNARSPEEQEQAIQVGFMEYIAELGAEYIGNDKAIPANGSKTNALQQGYAIMKGMMEKADGLTPSKPSSASAAQQQYLGLYVA